MPWREVQAVRVLTTELLPCAVYARRPVRGLFEYVDKRQGLLQRRTDQQPVAGLTGPADRAPTVNSLRLRLRDRIQDEDRRQERQGGPDDHTLDDTGTRHPSDNAAHVESLWRCPVLAGSR